MFNTWVQGGSTSALILKKPLRKCLISTFVPRLLTLVASVSVWIQSEMIYPVKHSRCHWIGSLINSTRTSVCCTFSKIWCFYCQFKELNILSSTSFSVVAFNCLTEFSFASVLSLLCHVDRFQRRASPSLRSYYRPPRPQTLLEMKLACRKVTDLYYLLLLSLSITSVYLSESASLQLLSVINTCFIQPDPLQDSCQTLQREKRGKSKTCMQRKERMIKQMCAKKKYERRSAAREKEL